mgnify:CR=1 FL=1|jgi:glycosyltransferase involved in cell wall biosynthesis
MLKICFIVSSSMHGGVDRVVSSLSNMLKADGHDVSILCSIPNHSYFKLKYSITDKSLFQKTLVRVGILFKMIAVEFSKLITKKNNLADRYEAQFESYTLLKMPKLNKDTHYILANNWYQYYEFKEYFESGYSMTLFLYHPEYSHLKSIYKNQVNRVYKGSDLHKITISNSTKREFKEIGCVIDSVIPLGVDHNIFNNFSITENKAMHILLYYDSNIRKGGKYGLDALKKIKEKYGNFKYSIVTNSKGSFPKWCNVYSFLSDLQMADLYKNTDIFIYPSTHEGFGLPPLEAMACSTAVIMTRTGESDIYAMHKKNAILVSKESVAEIVSAVDDLVNNNILKKIKIEAEVAAKKYTWRNSLNKLLLNLKNINN